MSTKRTIAINTTIQLIGKAIGTTSSLLIAFLIARTFGASYYGDFTKAFVTATLFFIGIDFGLNAIVVRRIIKDKANQEDEFRNLFGLRILFSLAFLIILAVFLNLIPTSIDQGYSKAVKLATLIFGLTFFEHASFTSANAIFQRRLEYHKSVIASATGSLVVLGAVVLAVAAKADIRAIAAAHVAGSLTMISIALFLVRGLTGRISPKFVWQEMSILFKEAFPIGATLILSVITTRIGTILLALFKTSSEVGFYGLAYRAFDVFLVFPIFFMNATYPIMVERVKEGRQGLKKIVSKSAVFLLIFALLGTAVLYTLSPYLSIIRAEFIKAQMPLRILSLSLPLFFLTALLQWTIITLKKEKSLIPIYASALMFNLLANLILIPRFGMIAAAINTAITEALILLLISSRVLQSFRQIRKNAHDARTLKT